MSRRVGILGFTGTRRGMTAAQEKTVMRLLRTAKPRRVVHGACIGADTQFHDIARGPTGEFAITIAVRPCRLQSQKSVRCVLDADEVLGGENAQPLERNRAIIGDADEMIACPAEFHEVIRSGTWATIRHTRAARKPLTIVWPDGGTTFEGIVP